MSKGIVYAGLWERGKLLMQYLFEENENLKQIARSLFERIDLTYDHRKSFSAHQGFTFQYIVEDEHAFLCAAVDGFPQRVCFAFLERFKNEFFDKYVGSSHIGSFKDFTKEEMTFFNSNPESDKLRALKGQVDDVTETMKKNMSKVLERGDRLEELETRSEGLSEAAVVFHSNAKKLKCELCKNNAKLMIAIAITTVVLVGVIVIVLIVIFSGDSNPITITQAPSTSTSVPTTTVATTTATTTASTTLAATVVRAMNGLI